MEIYVGTYDGTLAMLITTGSQIKMMSNIQVSQNSIKDLCFADAQKRYLVAGGHDQQLRVIDTYSKSEKIEAKQNKGQINIIRRINQQICAVGMDDGNIQIWDTNSWSIKKQQRIHKKAISSIFVSNNGKLMLSTGGNKLVVWNPTILKSSYQYKFQQYIEQVAVSPDLSHIFITSNNSLIEINIENNEQHKIISLDIAEKIQCIVILDEYILMGTSRGQIQAWKIGKYEHKIKFQAHKNRIKCMKIEQYDGFNYLIVGTSAGQISVWDFLEFLNAVEEISQDYNLQGLKALCQISINKRIISVETKILSENANQKQEQDENKEISKPAQNKQNIKKAKKIKKQPKKQHNKK